MIMNGFINRTMLFLAIYMFGFSGKVMSQNTPPDSIVFSTHWLPQAQFAGYYMAEKNGFYKEAGLKVKIIHPPANVNALKYLQDGTADIVSLFLVTAMEALCQEEELVNIAQMSEHSAIVFVSKEEKKIKNLEDFQNKKVGIWKSGFEEVPKSFLSENNIDVTWVPILSSVNLFLMGGIDLMTVMWYNEYNQIYLSGINEDEINSFFLKDYGYDVPEDGLYVMNASFELKKGDFTLFVEASLKGWSYAANHFDEAIEEVVKRMKEENIPASEAHQVWMLQKILSLQGFEGELIDKQVVLSISDFAKSWKILNQNKPITEKELLIQYEQFVRPLSGK